jgi:5'-deoxynucleotidase
MKTIRRWSLMRNIEPENIMEHSFQVATIAHSLAEMHNKSDDEQKVDVGRVVVIALYHDASEVMTGDMPTPIKYHNPKIRDAFHEIEDLATEKLTHTLPEILKDRFEDAMLPSAEESFEVSFIKAADKISAYLKCVEERRGGNQEFMHAERALLKEVRKCNLKVVDEWMTIFAPAFELSLDELTQID